MSRGRIEVVKDGLIRGWAWDPAEPNARLNLRFVIDGELAGSTEALIPRGDLAKAGFGDGCHGFEFVVPSRWRDGKPHTVTISRSDQSQEVVASQNVHLGTKRHTIVGRVERLSRNRIFGWAWDRALSGSRVEVQACAESRILATVIADIMRADLKRAGIGDGRHGFEIELDPEMLMNFGRTIQIRTSENFGGCDLGSVAVPTPKAQLANGQQRDVASGATKNPGGVPLEATPETITLTRPPLTASAQAALDAAHRKMKRLPREQLFIHARIKQDIDTAVIATDGDTLSVSVVQASGWIRIAHSAPDFHALSNFDWHLTVPCHAQSDGHTLKMVGLCAYLSNGSFKLVHRMAKDVNVSSEPDLLSFSLRRTAVTGMHEPDRADLPFFFILEFDEPCELCLGPIELQAVEPQEERIPYRRSDLRACTRLSNLNSTLASAGRRNTVKWALEEAEIAIRLECFETASRLLDNISLDQLPSVDLKKQYLTAFAEICLAEGRVDELVELATDHMEYVLRDDTLFTAYSLCFAADASLSDFFSKLPSGRLNRSFLSRAKLPGDTLKHLFPNNAGERRNSDAEQAQDRLLLGSQMRHVSPALYKKCWNDFLGQYGLSSISAMNLSSSNVLSSVRFADPPSKFEHVDKISIVMSAYNSEDTVEYAIRSILDQTYSNVELLVCDDCSTDASLSRIMKFRDNPSVRIFRSCENQGTYNIRNALIREATGKYLTFQDSDDLAHPERLFRQVSALKEPNAACAIARWVRVRPEGEVAFFRDQQCLRMCVVSLIAETSLYSELNGYRSVLCGADSDLFERIRLKLGAGAVRELAEPLILGLWSTQSLTQQSGLEATEDGYRAPARRAYAEIAARQRLLGAEIIPDATVDALNRKTGIYRSYAGVIALN